MDITAIGELAKTVGVPIAVCVLFLYIVFDLYKFWRDKASKRLEEQAKSMAQVKRALADAVEILEIMHGNLDEMRNRECPHAKGEPKT